MPPQLTGPVATLLWLRALTLEAGCGAHLTSMDLEAAASTLQELFLQAAAHPTLLAGLAGPLHLLAGEPLARPLCVAVCEGIPAARLAPAEGLHAASALSKLSWPACAGHYCVAAGAVDAAVQHFAAALPPEGAKAADSCQRLAALCLAAAHLHCEDGLMQATECLKRHSLYEAPSHGLGAAERCVQGCFAAHCRLHKVSMC